MNGKDVFNTFEFQNNCVVDNQIYPITAIKTDIFISDGKWHLPLKGDLAEV